MSLSMRTGFLLFCLLRGGDARRVSVKQHNSNAKSVASALATHLKGLGEEEPHHVCVTGNQASEAVDSYVLQGTQESRSDLPLTSLISQESCTVQEALVGNTLFTINADLTDECAARFKASSLTCDVLFHAHSGPDAEQLYKFRLMADNFDCNAAMIVVHDSPDMPANFNAKMSEHATQFPGQGCTQSPLWIDAKSQSVGNDVTQAFKDALAANAPAIRAQLKLASDDTGSSFIEGQHPANEKASQQRRLLQEAFSHKAAVVNVQHELLKMSQGLPVSAGARDLLKKVSKNGPSGTSSFMQEGPKSI